MNSSLTFVPSPDLLNSFVEAVAFRVAAILSQSAPAKAELLVTEDSDMTVADAAKILRFSQKHVRDLIKAGVLKGSNRNRGTELRAVWRLSKSDVESYRKSRK